MSDMRTNAGFVITNAIPVGNKEIVLGVNMKNAQSFVTWECKEGTDYYWGALYGQSVKSHKGFVPACYGRNRISGTG